MQKLAEKWIKGYIKNLYDNLKKDEVIIAHFWKEACIYVKNYYTDKEGECLANNVYYK
jgi:hypothetical protein